MRIARSRVCTTTYNLIDLTEGDMQILQLGLRRLKNAALLRRRYGSPDADPQTTMRREQESQRAGKLLADMRCATGMAE